MVHNKTESISIDWFAHNIFSICRANVKEGCTNHSLIEENCHPKSQNNAFCTYHWPWSSRQLGCHCPVDGEATVISAKLPRRFQDAVARLHSLNSVYQAMALRIKFRRPWTRGQTRCTCSCSCSSAVNAAATLISGADALDARAFTV